MTEFDYAAYQAHLLAGEPPFGGQFDANIAQAIESYQEIVGRLRAALEKIGDETSHQWIAEVVVAALENR